MKYEFMEKMINMKTNMEDKINIYERLVCKMQYVLAKDTFCELESKGLKYAIIKGCPLAYYKSGNVETRLSGDIDILISRDNVNRVIEVLEKYDYTCTYEITRAEKIMLISHSHQITSFKKTISNWNSHIDVNFDLFWGEYTGKRIDVADFIDETVEMEIYGCRIKTLSPLKTMIQLILHHYKEMNSLYHLMGHVAA